MKNTLSNSPIMTSILPSEPISTCLLRLSTVSAALHHRQPCVFLSQSGHKLHSASNSLSRCIYTSNRSFGVRKIFSLGAGSTLVPNPTPPITSIYTVGDFMTKKEELHVVRPTTTVYEALETLVDNRITGFPVVDDDWNLVGLVSDYDLLALDSISGGARSDTSMFPEVESSWKTFNEVQKLLSKTNGQMVGDLMTPAPIVVRESTNLEDAARLLLETKYRRLPVVDGDGKLVGILTRGDVVRAALAIKRSSE